MIQGGIRSAFASTDKSLMKMMNTMLNSISSFYTILEPCPNLNWPVQDLYLMGGSMGEVQ